MDFLEKKIKLTYGSAVLDASLLASIFYENHGYKTVEHCKCSVQNGRVLIYAMMKKFFQPEGPV